MSFTLFAGLAPGPRHAGPWAAARHVLGRTGGVRLGLVFRLPFLGRGLGARLGGVGQVPAAHRGTKFVRDLLLTRAFGFDAQGLTFGFV